MSGNASSNTNTHNFFTFRFPDADSDDDEPVARPLPSSLGLAHLAYLTTVMRSQISLSG